MDFTAWFAFVLVETALCLTPGPAVLYAFTAGARHGWRASLAANAGVVTGNSVYFLLSALGLSAVLLASHSLFVAIKWAGVAYLTWLGIRLIFAPSSEAAVGTSPPRAKIYRGGLILQLANPKSFIFFGAILPQFVDPNGTIWLQLLILGVTSQVIEALVLGGYGLAADRSARVFQAPIFVRWVERVSGGLLVTLGAMLATFRRSAS